jgi:hypothetical protein
MRSLWAVARNPRVWYNHHWELESPLRLSLVMQIWVTGNVVVVTRRIRDSLISVTTVAQRRGFEIIKRQWRTRIIFPWMGDYNQLSCYREFEKEFSLQYTAELDCLMGHRFISAFDEQITGSMISAIELPWYIVEHIILSTHFHGISCWPTNRYPIFNLAQFRPLLTLSSQ